MAVGLVFLLFLGSLHLGSPPHQNFFGDAASVVEELALLLSLPGVDEREQLSL
jgi:hypothetical protein